MGLQGLFLWVPGILFALTVHEYAHGWVADKLGDPTARLMGRLTFNPLPHLDPVGTLMLFFAHFGWAKPVPVDPYNLRDPKRDMIWISLAGPGANVLSAAFLGFVLRVLGVLHLPNEIILMFGYGVIINLILAVFNLIPIPPLDGSKILMGILPPEQEYKYRQIERYGPLILMGIIVSGWILPFSILWSIIGPIVSVLSNIFIGL